MKTTVKVEGLRETEASLAELGKSLGRATLRRVAKTALEPFDRAWRANAPDDPDGPAADLKSSGGIGTRLTRSQARQHRRMFKDDRATVEMFAGPNDPAAVALEFGTAERYTKAGAFRGSVEETAFVRPAWDATKGDMPDVVGRELWVEIEAAAKRRAARFARLAAKAAKAAG